MNNLDFNNSSWIKFLEVSYDGIIIADHNGYIVYMNPASEELEEASRDYIIGKHAKDLEEEGLYETSVTLQVLKTKKIASIIERRRDKQLLITGIPIFEKDEVKWVFINERDVTELNKMKDVIDTSKSQIVEYEKELKKLKKCLDNGKGTHMLATNSAVMRKIMDLLERIAPSDITVLLEGESGSGKDVFANWIHDNSDRSNMPFVKIDCSSLPENLLESELFGYQKGAFTGASKEGKIGLVEKADKGTLFLDEIGELPLSLQVKLLRLLQDRVFLPIGSTEEKKADLRIISATNRNISEMVNNRLFRKDLYYRLNVITVKLPPLRERKEDIFNFIQFFLNKYNVKYTSKKIIENNALNLLFHYDWPGNIRELSNVIERLVVITNKVKIDLKDVVGLIDTDKSLEIEEDVYGMDYKDAMEFFEKEYITRLLTYGKTIKELSNKLDVSESTVKRKLKKHKLTTLNRIISGL